MRSPQGGSLAARGKHVEQEKPLFWIERGVFDDSQFARDRLVEVLLRIISY